jgi:pimeloyl-ACP methyl ester carboxylesterase
MQLNFTTLGAGRPLACLHGFLGSGDNLWPLADHLKASHQSYLLDLRGHGKSPHGRPYTLEGMAADVAETLKAQGLTQVDVVGHSLGGKVAMALALHHPALVRRLVMADITMAQAEPYFGFLLDAMERSPVATFSRRDEGEPYLREAEPILETRRFLLKNLIPAEGGGFQWRFDLEGLRDDHPKVLAQVLEAPPFPGPALLIHGDRSSLVTPAGIELTRRCFPALRVLDLPGGHWIHVDAKERFNAAVEEFLDKA